MKLNRTLAAAAAALLLAGVSAAPAQAAVQTLTPAALPADAAVASDPDALPSPFYAAPAQLPAGNGTLVKQESAPFYFGPAKAAQLGKKSTRIMYTSLNSRGERTAVTGTVLESAAAWNGKGARPLVTYAVGTQGTANKCAPSVQGANGTEYESAGINNLLIAGYNVVVTDYMGLGTAGPHTYLNRLDQGRAVLDAVRAAQQLGIPSITEDTPVGIAGYSQGGGASAAAGEIHSEYAPEINLKAVYAGAVPANPGQVAKQIDSGTYNAFLFYSLQGTAASGNLDPNSFLNEAGQKLYATVSNACTLESGAAANIQTSTLTADGSTFTQMTAKEPLSSILAEQTLGTQGAPKVPTLISHSVMDDVIPYQTGRELAARYCKAGTPLTFEATLGATHVGGYIAAWTREAIFFDRQFNGLQSINSCWQFAS